MAGFPLLCLSVLLQIQGFLLTNCFYIHISTYICIPRYNPLDLYNATHMYVFRADSLVLDNLFVFYGKNNKIIISEIKK